MQAPPESSLQSSPAAPAGSSPAAGATVPGKRTAQPEPTAPTAPTAPADATTVDHLTAENIFARRHHGQSDADRRAMLTAVGVDSLTSLIDQTLPEDIRLGDPLRLVGLDPDRPLSEAAALAKLRGYADRNRPMTSMIGMGYYGTLTPPVILRNILENPRWYTPYTPYQAEIAQGRLEALLNFQTVVSDLTGLPLAGASLLDEATAAAEAMAMCFNIARQNKTRFLVAQDCHPQTLAVVKTRAAGLGIEVIELPRDYAAVDPAAGPGQTVDESGGLRLPESGFDGVCGVLLQYPTTDGRIEDYRRLAESAHGAGALVVAATDLLACCLIPPPGEWGADIAVGSSQRFGVPMGYGGPHAAFLATHEQHARKMPGRLIGVSRDTAGRPAYRMAIQTREQHIKRDKATSNICTSQVLLAIAAGFYAVYHGPAGLRHIARRVHRLTAAAAQGLRDLGYEVAGDRFFDTLTIKFRSADALLDAAADKGINLRKIDATTVGLSLDQTTTPQQLRDLFEALAFGSGKDQTLSSIDSLADRLEADLPERQSEYLQHPVFQKYHTEHELLRYANRLIAMDYGLADGMIPLGSCTMKLNAAAEMIPITWPGFAELHPFCPADQAAGYRQLLADLEAWLAEITGFAAVSLQPNAGSQGEYAGLMAIRAYHLAQGADTPRTVCLIPTSAHGTNPASAVIAGMRVVPIACRANGDIDLQDLKTKAAAHADELACLMITYPSTHGVFEATVRDACAIVHDRGGLVYMDGANMNAQVGLTSPGLIGADVCHLNLHKTFCIPHGGGGPGMGPIGVTERLAEFLPGHPLGIADSRSGISEQDRRGTRPPSLNPNSETHNPSSDYCVSAAPYGSPMILPITWMYIAMMGPAGLTEATRAAILNANYMAARLRDHYDILYAGPGGRVAHEFILDCRPFDKRLGITIDDIAKRLMDYGFHAPTMSWPVAGTLMIEPTESESRAELDRFCDAMIAIRGEIAEVEKGTWPRDDNPLKHAPHPAARLAAADWPHPYPRQLACYPMPDQQLPGRKYWPPIARIDNPYGDRNLTCTCPPMDSYKPLPTTSSTAG